MLFRDLLLRVRPVSREQERLACGRTAGKLFPSVPGREAAARVSTGKGRAHDGYGRVWQGCCHRCRLEKETPL
jgi:hypothetical protein